MTQFIARQIAERVLKENASNQYGREDTYFEQVPATRINQDKRSLKKGRKARPPGISDQDFKVLTKVKRRAHFLDSKFSFCGIRVGFSSIIGFVPLLGDCIDVFCALMVVRTCSKIEGGLPMGMLFRMFMSIAIDFGIGLVPVIGDIGDALYKANTLNAGRLEKYLREKGRTELRKSGLPLPATDPSDPQEFDRYQQESLPQFNRTQSDRQNPQSIPMTVQPSNTGPRKQGSGPQQNGERLPRQNSEPGNQRQPKRVAGAQGPSNGSQQETGILTEPNPSLSARSYFGANSGRPPADEEMAIPSGRKPRRAQ